MGGTEPCLIWRWKSIRMSVFVDQGLKRRPMWGEKESTYITVTSKATKSHLVSGLLEARRRPAATSRGLGNWRRRVSRRGNSVVAVALRNWDRSRVADMRSAVAHGRGVVAKLNGRLGGANGAAVGDEAAGAVSSHGDGAFSKMVGRRAVESAAASDGGGRGLFAVYWRRS